MTRRNHDWPEALNRTVTEARTMPLVWGQHDCALFAASAIEAMTGIDVAKKFRGKYKTARGAAGQMKKFAGGGIPELADKIAAQHGFESIPVAFAQRGDVVETDTPEGPGLGVCVGAEFVIIGESGLVDWPMTEANRAWRIG
ncbi:MAG: hypothetical protein KAJ19_14005 [Gammaproteobacteria bacterium]|nr:hypothetical protein [Gammaproteobacteria bacterium]